MKTLFMTIAILGVAAIFNNSSAQVSVSCPSGDWYKCADGTNSDGSSWTVYKGNTGDTIISLPTRSFE